MRKYLIFAGIIAIGIAGWMGYQHFYKPSSKTLPVETSTGFVYEYARTKEEQERGLSGRTSLPANHGLLFVFTEPDLYGFWMKDMLIPIDILWLSDTGEVITVKTNVSPDTYPDVFYPTEPVRYVLETAAGESIRKGWIEGSVIPLPLHEAL